SPPLGMGGMALAPRDNERAVERAGPANFYRVPKGLRARWFADDAMIETLAFLVSPAQEFFGAVDRRAFLVAGDEKPNRALGQPSLRNKGAGSGGEGGNPTLHVGG